MLRTITSAAALAVGVLLLGEASAAELKVLTAAVMKPVFVELSDDFEHTSGHKLTISYVPAGAVKSRIEGGEYFDVAILQRPAAEDLARQGRINPRNMTTLARSGLAVAIRKGMPKPDISTIEA